MTMRRLPWGVRRLFRLPMSRERLLREMDEEIRAHLAMRVAELRALGLSEKDAEAEALRRFGDDGLYRAYAETRAAREGTWRGVREWADEWTQDIRFAFRQFRRNAGFAALAVLTLALGIGANTAIFSVVQHLLITPLPYPDGNRIVRLVLTDGENPRPPDVVVAEAWHKRARSFESIEGVMVQGLRVQNFSDAKDTTPAVVSAGYFKLLGLRPALGRDFTADDQRPGAPPVAMIGYGKWQREFGGDSGVIGKTLRVTDPAGTYTIVGVAPRDAAVPMTKLEGVNKDLTTPPPGIWVLAGKDMHWFPNMYAKLRRGVSAEDASRELEAIRASTPAPKRRLGFGTLGGTELQKARAMRAQDFLDRRETQTVRVLFVAVGALLLIACANVANLLMSRAWTRRREFAVRSALGAGRARLARQVLTESVLLALAGGVAGVGIAWVTLEVILALRPATLDELTGVGIQNAVLLWSAAISVVTGILFGCAPAFFAAARRRDEDLRSGSRAGIEGGALRRMRSSLIVLEIAISLVLLVGAGLLVRSFVALQAVPRNFEPKGLVSATSFMMFPREWTADVRAAQREALLERVRAIPGVTGASVGMMPGLGWSALSVTLESDSGRSVEGYSGTFVTPEYFAIAQMPIVAGRPPAPASRGFGESGESVEIVINRSLARRLWPDGNALGARITERVGNAPMPPPPPGAGPPAASASTYIVSGIVEDIQMPGAKAGEANLYMRIPPMMGFLPLVARTTLSEAEIVGAIRRVVAEYDPVLRGASGMSDGALVQSATFGETYLREALAPTRFAMALLLAFALVALLLSTVGLYGVIAYSVTRRTHEIGVRVALGADRRAVQRLVIGDGLRLTVLGLVIGVGAALLSTRLLAGLLFGVSPVDPTSFVAIGMVILVTAVLACWAPARRALRIAPMEALRAD